MCPNPYSLERDYQLTVFTGIGIASQDRNLLLLTNKELQLQGFKRPLAALILSTRGLQFMY